MSDCVQIPVIVFIKTFPYIYKPPLLYVVVSSFYTLDFRSHWESCCHLFVIFPVTKTFTSKSRYEALFILLWYTIELNKMFMLTSTLFTKRMTQYHILR